MSKADTLARISNHVEKSIIEEIYSLTETGWLSERIKITKIISKKYSGRTIIVRSSALLEDSATSSYAGQFKSVAHVDSSNHASIAEAIDQVIESYQNKGVSNPNNLVLIQNQTLDVVSSGVTLTRSYNDSPYYVVNYEDGSDTTIVTSGLFSKSIKFLKHSEMRVPARFKKLIEAVKEIESLHPENEALDIEYAIKRDGTVVTFQVRPLVLKDKQEDNNDSLIIERIDKLEKKFKKHSGRKAHLAGDVTYFGDMPDWNPAEIIGNSPRPLAFGLYDYVITSEIWHKARTSQSYNNVSPAKLVTLFGNKPYVDVRSSFNSLIPSSVGSALRKKLMNFYLAKLRKNPDLQDKVEFNILFTCYDLSFALRSKELIEFGFSKNEINSLKSDLLKLTNSLLDKDSIDSDIRDNEMLELKRKNISSLSKNPDVSELLSKSIELLDNCKSNGTFQFSRLARQAFISKAILKSLIDRNLLSKDMYESFLESINTVASDFTDDVSLFYAGKLSKNKLINKYGHLRPGTYNIETARYDENDDYLLLQNKSTEAENLTNKDFKLTKKANNIISEAFEKNGILVKSEDFFNFARSSLEAREYSKFLFTKCISDALKFITVAGAKLGFSKTELAYLDIASIKKSIYETDKAIEISWGKIIQGNKLNYSLNNCLYLPPIIFSSSGFKVVQSYASHPNYITTKKINGEAIFLDKDSSADITNKIVVLESADPGYDWVFAHNPAALITKYGGPASHMAIRCSELALPAIIGAGDIIYDNILKNKKIMIDCETQKVTSFIETMS